MRKNIFIFILALFFLCGSAGHCAAGGFSQEDDHLLTFYYQDPQPAKIPGVLRNYLNSNVFRFQQVSNTQGAVVAAYLFSRILRLNPSLAAEYEKIFEETTYEGRLFMLNIFQLGGDPGIESYLLIKKADPGFSKEKIQIEQVLAAGIPVPMDPLKKAIEQPSDINLVWSEFMASGDTQAVEKIMSVLEREDRTREKLLTYLKEPGSFDEKKKLMDLMAREFGIRFDLANLEILSKENLDVAVASFVLGRNRQELLPILQKYLNWSDQDQREMALKGNAQLSLASNAGQHPRVFETIKNKIRTSPGPALIELLKISSVIYTSEKKLEETVLCLKKLLELNPFDPSPHYSLGMIYLKTKNIPGALGEVKALKAMEPVSAQRLEREVTDHLLFSMERPAAGEKVELDKNSFLEKMRKAWGEVKNYRTQCLKKEGRRTVYQWDAASIKPGKWEVAESSIDGKNERWMSFGEKKYVRDGSGWQAEEASFSEVRGRDQTLESLKMEKYFSAFEKAREFEVFRSDDGNGARFFLLTFSLEELPPAFFGSSGTSLRQLSLWVREENALIAKAVVEIPGVKDEPAIRYEQIFLPEKELWIEEPAGGPAVRSEKGDKP